MVDLKKKKNSVGVHLEATEPEVCKSNLQYPLSQTLNNLDPFYDAGDLYASRHS